MNKDPISSAVFRRLAQRTGGKAYWAKTWQKQVEAFEDIREDLGNSYTVTYYPAPNPNEGFRKISVEIVSDPGKKYRVQVAAGLSSQPRRRLIPFDNRSRLSRSTEHPRRKSVILRVPFESPAGAWLNSDLPCLARTIERQKEQNEEYFCRQSGF